MKSHLDVCQNLVGLCGILATIPTSLGLALPASGGFQVSTVWKQATLTPGPGLPTLAGLGITIEDLLAESPSRSAAPLTRPTAAALAINSTTESQDGALAGRSSDAAQYNPKCYHANTATTGPAKLCYDYLNKIGSQTCLATRDTPWTYMCNATVDGAHAYVRGQPVPGFDQISSPCSAVARGMDWILELCVTVRCTGDGCVVGGTNAVWGNGDFAIEIVGNATDISST